MLRLSLVLSAILLLSPYAYGQIIEVTGRSAIINNNDQQAREQAIERALSQIALLGHSSLNYQEQMQNGVLTQQELDLSGHTEIASVKVTNEQRTDGQLHVTLQVQTLPTLQAQCHNHNNRVAITIPRAHIRNRDQLAEGAIYDIDSAFSSLISNMLEGEGRYTQGQYRDQVQTPAQIPSPLWVQTLGRDDHSQYVLALQFDDLSLERSKNLFGYWQQDAIRHFAYSARLIDAFTGQVTWQQRYRNQGLWPFAQNAQVKASTDPFWQSDFGQALQHSAFLLVAELDKYLSCATLKGRIRQLDGDLGIIDLGSNHGLKQGDYLTLVPQQQTWGQPSQQRLRLETVEANQARARLIGQGQQIGIQLGDWVYKKPEQVTR